MTAEAAAPPRPDPWATTQPREAMRDTNAGRIVSLAPSVNLTPVGGTMVPVPYNVVDFTGHDDDYTPTVRFTSQRAMVLRSITEHVHGDAAGTGGGVASGTVGGICEPIGHAAQVRAEGSPVIRHLDQCWMNNRNTVGEALLVRDTGSYPAPEDSDPIPGSLARPVLAFSQAPPGNVLEAPLRPPPAPVRPPPAPVRPPPVRPPWFELPPEPPPVLSAEGAAEGVLRWGKWGGAILGGLILLLTPTNKAALDDVIPQDEFEQDVVKEFEDGLHRGADSWEMRKWAQKEIQQHRRQVTQDHESTRPQVTRAPSGNARITGKRGPDPKNPCILIPYGFLVCPKVKDAKGNDTDISEQSHHVVADRAFRSGARSSTWDQTGYISGMSQGAGLAMCLEGNASNPASDHGIATEVYGDGTRAEAKNGMVPLGTAEAAGALGIQAVTHGRCKASDIQAQLRAYHQKFGMGPDTMVRQSMNPLEAGHTPALGSRAGEIPGR